jgi:hypothetical protein
MTRDLEQVGSVAVTPPEAILVLVAEARRYPSRV